MTENSNYYTIYQILNLSPHLVERKSVVTVIH